MACSLGSRAPALARSSGPGPEGASLGAEGVCVDGFIWACVPVCRLIASGFQESSWYLERRRGGGEVVQAVLTKDHFLEEVCGLLMRIPPALSGNRSPAGGGGGGSP